MTSRRAVKCNSFSCRKSRLYALSWRINSDSFRPLSKSCSPRREIDISCAVLRLEKTDSDVCLRSWPRLAAMSTATYELEMANATANATMMDVEAFLEQNLGRRYRSLTESVVLVTVYCVIFLTGIAGNLCTCIVIVRNKRMHTATNYYLFSLAVSDLLTLLLGQSLPLYVLIGDAYKSSAVASLSLFDVSVFWLTWYIVTHA